MTAASVAAAARASVAAAGMVSLAAASAVGGGDSEGSQWRRR